MFWNDLTSLGRIHVEDAHVGVGDLHDVPSLHSGGLLHAHTVRGLGLHLCLSAIALCLMRRVLLTHFLEAIAVNSGCLLLPFQAYSTLGNEETAV